MHDASAPLEGEYVMECRPKDGGGSEEGRLAEDLLSHVAKQCDHDSMMMLLVPPKEVRIGYLLATSSVPSVMVCGPSA